MKGGQQQAAWRHAAGLLYPQAGAKWLPYAWCVLWLPVQQVGAAPGGMHVPLPPAPHIHHPACARALLEADALHGMPHMWTMSAWSCHQQAFLRTSAGTLCSLLDGLV